MVGHGPTDMGQEVRETIASRIPMAAIGTGSAVSMEVDPSRGGTTVGAAPGSALHGSVDCAARGFGREPRSSGQEWLRAENGVGGP